MPYNRYMAGAKIAIRGKKSESGALPPEERWAVIGTEENAFPGRPIYLESADGIGQAEAEALAARLSNARAVPRASLDRHSRYQKDLHAAWEEAHGEAKADE